MDRFIKANAVLSIFAKNYMKLKKNLPIRPSEMGVLNIITQTEGLHTPVELAEKLGVSKPMITAHITSLEKNGYVTKSPCEQDKRAYYILPTEKASALVETAKNDLNAHLDQLANAMGQEEFDTFIRLANTANEILDDR